MAAPADVASALYAVLKRYDRIGFGRRGVLDAEQEIVRIASQLSHDDHARLCEIVLSWIDGAMAEQVTAALHYNLPEHVQALAIRLCAGIPIPGSLPLLRQVEIERTFTTEERRVCLDALRESLARLGTM